MVIIMAALFLWMVCGFIGWAYLCGLPFDKKLKTFYLCLLLGPIVLIEITCRD